MARAAIKEQPIAQLRAVEVTDHVFPSDVIARGHRKVEVEGDYARFFPKWDGCDAQKMPVSVLVPIAAIPGIIEEMLAVLGHRPVWPEKH